MLKRAVAYCLFAIGFLVVQLFDRYSGTIPANVPVYWAIGIICWVAGFVLLIISNKKAGNEDQKKLKQNIIALKKSGERINVNLSECEIKSNDYSEEVNAVSGTAAEFNSLIRDQAKSVVSKDVFQSVIIYRRSYLGKTEIFRSPVIPIEHTALLFKLDNQKTTVIYVDRNNHSNYYIDLEFLLQ